MKKILIVLTNTTHYGNSNEPTGLWLGEAAEFADEVQSAGFEVDYISPKGGFVPLDPRGMKYVDDAIMKFYKSHDFQRRALCDSLRPQDVNPNDYAAIYYAGGHGAMWDFPDNKDLQKLALAIYANNGYLTSICHGVAGLLNIKDTFNHYLIAGQKITGFTKAEELIAGKIPAVPFYNKDVAKKHGANFKEKRPYADYAIQDKQFITGQNPLSTRSVAKLLIKNLTSKK